MWNFTIVPKSCKIKIDNHTDPKLDMSYDLFVSTGSIKKYIFKFEIVLGVYWTTLAKVTSLQKSLKTEWEKLL